jgi:putative membrane protein
MALLDQAARQRIEAAIADVERRTSGEIVVVSVPASDRYYDVRLLFALCAALAVAALVHSLLPALSVTVLLLLQALTAGLSFGALGAAPLLRRAAPDARRAEAVLRRAREEFLEHAVFATRDRTGILILLSELEHKVVILGDSGIDAHVNQEGWERHVASIVASIRAGDPAAGVCSVIAELGELLATKLPIRAGDQDELSNEVRQDER